MDAKIAPTDFTVRYVFDCLHSKDERWDRLNATSKLGKVDLLPVSGNGYCSFVNRVVFWFEGELEPFSVIMKVPTIAILEEHVLADEEDPEKGKKMVEDYTPAMGGCHDKELLFYEHVAMQSPLVCLPKIYAAKGWKASGALSSSFILMEDLGSKGGLADVGEGLTKVQIENAIRAIAEFHAFSLTLPKDLLLETLATVPFDDADSATSMTLPKLLALECDYFRKHEKAVRKFLTTTPWPEQVEFYTKFGISPVLAHGDMWMNNIFFKKDNQGNVTDELCAFLDWQVAHPNTGIGDLGHLILIGANAKLREAHLDEWLKLYYDTFEASTKQFGVPNQYTLDVVKNMFHHHYPSELMFALLALSLSLDKTTKEGQKNLAERMISCFEVVRKDYE